MEVKQAGLLEGTGLLQRARPARQLYIDGHILAALAEALYFVLQYLLVQLR